MPWKESHPVEQRMRFVVRLRDGEPMAELCREFGISRKTGYKFWERYKEAGATGLLDESRAPDVIPHRTKPEVCQALVAARKAHPTWGGRKLKAWLNDKEPGIQWPVASTISTILKREGLVTERRRRPRGARPFGQPLTQGSAPNDVWCADYKGQFRVGTGQYCFPLTASDLASRFLVALEALEGTDEEGAREGFSAAFREYGLPSVIRTDNGSPFASQALANLTRLSAWWLRLGIKHERIEPGHPEQNGQHERMHRTLKAETTRPAGKNFLQQQERFDGFREEYNTERPHEALGDRPPARVYEASTRPFPEKLSEPTYPLHDDVLLVGKGGHIRLPRARHVFLTTALAGELVGLREMDDGRWLVSFVSLDLGAYDPKAGRFQPASADGL
jgi:transposase InsO family protein